MQQYVVKIGWKREGSVCSTPSEIDEEIIDEAPDDDVIAALQALYGERYCSVGGDVSHLKSSGLRCSLYSLIECVDEIVHLGCWIDITILSIEKNNFLCSRSELEEVKPFATSHSYYTQETKKYFLLKHPTKFPT